MKHKKEIIFRTFDFPKTCPKGHKEIEILDYEKLDLLDHFEEKEINWRTASWSGKVRKCKLYGGVCRVYCHICKKEYNMDCYISECTEYRKK